MQSYVVLADNLSNSGLGCLGGVDIGCGPDGEAKLRRSGAPHIASLSAISLSRLAAHFPRCHGTAISSVTAVGLLGKRVARYVLVWRLPPPNAASVSKELFSIPVFQRHRLCGRHGQMSRSPMLLYRFSRTTIVLWPPLSAQLGITLIIRPPAYPVPLPLP